MARPRAEPRVKMYEEPMADGRTRFRVRVKDNGGAKDSIFWKQPEAQDFFARMEQELVRRSGHTLGELLDAYFAEKTQLGKAKAQTCADQRRCIELVLADCLDMRIAEFSPKRAAALYDSLIRSTSPKTGKPLEAATHQFYLILVRSFFAWSVRKGYLQKNPFLDVLPVGRRSTGKPQLRAVEAERFVNTALRLYDEQADTMALAAVMLLTFGLRASEALSRRVRDIDPVKGKWLLWVDEGMGDVTMKSRNARRHYEIPAFLTPRLERLLSGRDPDAWLFGEGRPGRPKGRQLLWSTVRRICGAAAVPVVCPHSLRGLNATLGLEAGMVPHAVASALGHGSFAMTAKHYAQPEAIVEARTARMLGVLDLLGPAPSAEPNPREQAQRLLQSLDAQTLAHLTELLARK